MNALRDLAPRLLVLAAMLAAVGFGTVSCTANPAVETGPGAEVTYDGLHRVDHATMDAAWMKPDLNLSAYTGLILTGAGMSFKPVDDDGQRWWPGLDDQGEFPISEENRKRLHEEMRTAFAEELSKLERFEIVQEPGPGVLLLAGALIDVVSRVPPVDECVGRCDVYLSEIGEATLVLELRDSVTNEVLVRAVDGRVAESDGWAIEGDSMTVWPEVRRLAQSWARLARLWLEQLGSPGSIADASGR